MTRLAQMVAALALPFVAAAAQAVEKIGRAVMDVVKTPDVKSRMAAVGFEPRGDGPDAVVEIIRTGLPKWAEVIRRSGLKLSE
jgi:tripartite-type tricarboxylate transporter receptor subunit TctC